MDTPLILKTLNKEQTKEKPVWLMRQAGRYLPEYKALRKKAENFLSFCYNPDMASEATMQPLRRYNLDAGIIFSDILVIPDALNIKTSFQENIGPVLEKIDPNKNINEIVDNTKLSLVYEAIDKTKSQMDKKTALIGFSGAPWTLFAYMAEGKSSKEFLEAKNWIYNHPEKTRKWFEVLVNVISNHLINQVKAGAQILQIFDSWAGILPEQFFDELLLKPINKIISNVKKEFPEVPIIVFARCCGVNYPLVASKTGCDAISVDHFTPISKIKDEVKNIAIQGNLDPFILTTSKNNIKTNVERIIQQMENSLFIFNLGHGVIPQTPPENVEFLVNTIKKIK